MKNHLIDLPDYHTHNELCQHASGRTIDYAKAAIKKGLSEFAATDHCPTDCGFGQDHRMYLEQFPDYVNDVNEAREACPNVRILLGIEADYYVGCEEFMKGMLNQWPFDIILGSVHFRNFWATDKTKWGLADGDKPIAVWQEYFALIGKLADSGLYDVVGHLDLPKRFGNELDPVSFQRCALPALDKIAAAGMAIEINTSGVIHSQKEMYPSATVLSWAAERGIGLTFGSDSHSPERIGDEFSAALNLARNAGFTEARRYRSREWTNYSLQEQQSN